MTSLLPSVLLGSQEPTHLLRPPWASSAGAEAVELAELAGLNLDPWQALALEVALAERPDGRWSAFELALIVPRQNGKGGFLEALQLAALFLLGDELIIHTAHEVKTALESFRRLLVIIERCDDLAKRLHRISNTNGREGLELTTGQRLNFFARSKGSGRGFTADRIIFDEAYELSAAAIQATIPTLAAVANPQVVYTSSAPLLDVGSDVLRRICKRGRTAAPGSLAYLEWCADAADSSDDVAAWARANPAFGRRISEEFIRHERDAMAGNDDGWRVERLGLWVDIEASGAGVIPLDLWDRCLVQTSQPGRVAYAFDVAEDRSWSAIGVSDGQHLEIIEHLPGTGWLPARMAGIVARNAGTVACDGTGPAASLIPAMAAQGLEVEALPAQQMQRASASLYDLVIGGNARHIGQPGLRTALTGASKRPVGDAWVWSRRSSVVDISPVVAVTVAAWAATGGQSGSSAYESRGFTTLG